MKALALVVVAAALAGCVSSRHQVRTVDEMTATSRALCSMRGKKQGIDFDLCVAELNSVQAKEQLDKFERDSPIVCHNFGNGTISCRR